MIWTEKVTWKTTDCIVIVRNRVTEMYVVVLLSLVCIGELIDSFLQMIACDNEGCLYEWVRAMGLIHQV